ncbi:replication initiation factor domain-containing protein [Dyella sp. 2RAF44]|uniref:replication initiation factor domain-containing protein n=1 Tax=Dyella sp. 2RAF44 TaxID=3233000 RepID=UPI003F932EA7
MGFALGIDYCTLVFPASEAERLELVTVQDVVAWLYPNAPLAVGPVEAKRWQFYAESAYIFSPDGKVVGRIGLGGNGNGVCVSLSGAGCTLVDDWFCVSVQARRLRAHISRADIAFDDFEGQIFRDIREVNVWALEGKFDAKQGRPADTYMIDDHGKGKGCSVYVGSRGRKQLCIYEKGKQLKDRHSRWIRCELRLWAADCVLPLELLYSPLAFLRGSYALLEEILPQEAEAAKPERIARTVNATAHAALKFLRTQCGPTLDLFIRAIGPDVWPLLQERVLRSEVPRRFKGVARDLETLRTIVREQLGFSQTDYMNLAV